jgi:hypothetical protein
MTQNFGTNDEVLTGSNVFFFILSFSFLERDATNLRGILVENFVTKSTQPIPQYRY